MHIALIGAEFEENLAVRYIRGALEQRGQRVTQLTFNDPGDVDRIARELAHSDAELAGYSMVFTARAREFADLATAARALGYRGFQVAGGHFAAFNAEALLRDVPALDAVALGEGELTMCELAAHLDAPQHVAGLVLRGRESVSREGNRADDLDLLPWPTRKDPPHQFLGLPIVNMLASRGCSHGCAFCSIVAWHGMLGGAQLRTPTGVLHSTLRTGSPRLRMRRPDEVARELAQLYHRGVRIFNFHDDNFLPRRVEHRLVRLRQLRDALGSMGVGRIAFAIKCRPDEVELDLMRELVAMGLFRVFLGVEAGSAEALRQLGRGQRVEHNVRALQILRQLDVHTCFNLLMLNPDTTLEDFAVNVAFLRDHPHNPMNFCRTEVYAGTPLERRLRREGRLLGDYWGRHYRIADEQAQRVFELFYPVFRRRNFAHDGLHHLTMQVDYEHQLLSHFFDTTPRLRRQVKQFVVEVNHNTCSHLERIVELARACAPDGLPHPMQADDARLERRGHQLVQQIRLRAVSCCALRSAPERGSPAPRAQRQTPTSSPWARRAAAAGLAATISLSGACKKVDCGPSGHGSQVYEMVAQPLEGDPALIHDPLGRVLLPAMANTLERASELQVVVVLDRAGNLTSCRVLRTEREVPCPTLAFRTERAEAFGRRFRLSYTEQEVARAMAQHTPDAAVRPADLTPAKTHMSEMVAPPTHMPEMAPRPSPMPPTHMGEMLPEPTHPPKPGKPTTPRKPRKPAKPGKPKKPAKPGKPTEPKKPDPSQLSEMAPAPFVPPKDRRS